MLVKYIRMLGLLSGLTLLPGIAGAQTTPCDPSKLYPGLTLRDLSRDTDGFIGADTKTLVYFAECKTTNTITRNTLYQPFSMSLVAQGCDEVKEFSAVLRGQYYSVKRMNDTHPNKVASTDPNRYIGYEYATGKIIESTTGIDLGTFTMNGVIGTNTSRRPMPDSTGDCYDCSHHEGYVTFTFTEPRFRDAATFAEYHFHTLETPGGSCEQMPPCQITDNFRGVVDGIWLNRCASVTSPN